MTVIDRIQTYIGKNSAETIERLEAQGIPVRVMAEDGETFFGTMDYRPNRVNLEIEKGVITNAYAG